jgi:hypothetical protein
MLTYIKLRVLPPHKFIDFQVKFWIDALLCPFVDFQVSGVCPETLVLLLLLLLQFSLHLDLMGDGHASSADGALLTEHSPTPCWILELDRKSCLHKAVFHCCQQHFVAVGFFKRPF